MHEIGDDALSEPLILGIGGVVGVELGELFDELSKGPLLGVPVAANDAHVCILSSAEPL